MWSIGNLKEQRLFSASCLDAIIFPASLLRPCRLVRFPRQLHMCWWIRLWCRRCQGNAIPLWIQMGCHSFCISLQQPARNKWLESCCQSQMHDQINPTERKKPHQSWLPWQREVWEEGCSQPVSVHLRQGICGLIRRHLCGGPEPHRGVDSWGTRPA